MNAKPILLLKVDTVLTQSAIEQLRNSAQAAVKREYIVLISDRALNLSVEIVANDILHKNTKS